MALSCSELLERKYRVWRRVGSAGRALIRNVRGYLPAVYLDGRSWQGQVEEVCSQCSFYLEVLATQ